MAGRAAQQNIHLKAFSIFPCRLADSLPFKIVTLSRLGPQMEVPLKFQALQTCCECIQWVEPCWSQ